MTWRVRGQGCLPDTTSMTPSYCHGKQKKNRAKRMNIFFLFNSHLIIAFTCQLEILATALFSGLSLVKGIFWNHPPDFESRDLSPRDDTLKTVIHHPRCSTWSMLWEMSAVRTSHGGFPSSSIGDKIGETLSSNWVTENKTVHTPLPSPPLQQHSIAWTG